MASIHKQRMTVEFDGDFVVFLIGARINKPWKIHKWWPVFTAMPRMLKELANKPESGFLGYENGFPTIVQYWRSFEDLERYARSKDGAHWPAWVHFNKKIGHASGDVGIWHETFKVSAGQYEAIYGGMPPKGLGRIGRLVPVSSGREAARDRIGAATT